MTSRDPRQLSLFETGDQSPLGGARVVPRQRATANDSHEASAPGDACPAGDLLSDLHDLDPHDLAFLKLMRSFDCAQGVREDLAERRRRTRADDARKAMEAAATAEADRVAAEAEALRLRQVDSYRAFVDDALSYLYA